MNQQNEVEEIDRTGFATVEEFHPIHFVKSGVSQDLQKA